MIAEGFIIYKKPDGDYDGFLAQVAYDPFVHKPGHAIDSGHFTGMILHADWGESGLRGWRYLDGKLESRFDHENINNKGARQKQCFYSYYSYQTVTGQSCGTNCYQATVTLHQDVYMYCDESSTGPDTHGSGIQGYPYYYAGGGITTPPSSSGPTPFVNYDFNKIAQGNNQDAHDFQYRLNTTLQALGITALTFGGSQTYAQIMVKSLGMEDAFVTATATALTSAGRVLGVAGIVIGGTQVIIGLTDGDITRNDVLNTFGLVFAGVAVVSSTGWIIGGAAAISAGVALYTMATDPH